MDSLPRGCKALEDRRRSPCRTRRPQSKAIAGRRRSESHRSPPDPADLRQSPRWRWPRLLPRRRARPCRPRRALAGARQAAAARYRSAATTDGRRVGSKMHATHSSIPGVKRAHAAGAGGGARPAPMKNIMGPGGSPPCRARAAGTRHALSHTRTTSNTTLCRDTVRGQNGDTDTPRAGTPLVRSRRTLSPDACRADGLHAATATPPHPRAASRHLPRAAAPRPPLRCCGARETIKQSLEAREVWTARTRSRRAEARWERAAAPRDARASRAGTHR